MKTLLILPCLLFIGFSLTAQEKIPECLVAFPEKRVRVEDAQIAVIDSAWDALKTGKRVRLTTLTNEENKQKDANRMVLSEKRCQYIMAYLMRLDIPVTSYATLIEPFDKKKKSAVSEMTNAGYRTMARADGIYTVVLYREGSEPIPFTGSDTMDFEFNTCQNQTLNIAAGGQIYGNQGTVIKFRPASLVFLNGDAPDCAVANICLREFYNKGDIVAAGLSTHSYKRMLQSGGMIYIEATCNGKKLRLVSGKPIEIMFPTNGDKKVKGMHTFYGKHQDNLTNWLPSVREEGKTSEKPVVKPTVIDGEYTEDSYEESEEAYSKTDAYFMESSRLGWINCDLFYDVPDKTDLYVKTDTVLKPAVRLVFTDIRSVMPGYRFSGDHTAKFQDIPNGKEATVVVFAQKGDQLYLGTELVKIGSLRTVEVTMRAVTKDEFKKEMSNLN